ncbi:unnamed protein product, partial [Mesorhabditis belari]|uniref:FLYWCH-type domain-containing protein n=1 Tax=Mesorhabditis belari TaxID=2138241 RepID=A0AAF3J856_9BILA
MIAMSQRAKGLIYDDEMFEYRKDKVLKSGKISYRCTKAGCKGRVHYNGSIVATISSHTAQICGLPPNCGQELRDLKFDQLARRQVKIPGSKDWPAPINASELRVPFLRYDNCARFLIDNKKGLKVFMSDWGHDKLAKNDCWSMDGTFYASPFGFKQIFVIGVEIAHLLFHVHTHSFKKVFQHQPKLKRTWRLQSLMASMVLQYEAYINLPSFANELRGVFEYFENSYIGKVVMNRYVLPLHPIENWNSFGAVMRDEQIGSSSQEGYNAKLKEITSKCSAQFVAMKLLEVQETYEKIYGSRWELVLWIREFSSSS